MHSVYEPYRKKIGLQNQLNFEGEKKINAERI